MAFSAATLPVPRGQRRRPRATQHALPLALSLPVTLPVPGTGTACRCGTAMAPQSGRPWLLQASRESARVHWPAELKASSSAGLRPAARLAAAVHAYGGELWCTRTAVRVHAYGGELRARAKHGACLQNLVRKRVSQKHRRYLESLNVGWAFCCQFSATGNRMRTVTERPAAVPYPGRALFKLQ